MLYLPNEIKLILKDKKCNIDRTGMSSAKVYVYDDYVLKIEKISNDVKNSISILNWINENSDIVVPKVIKSITTNDINYLLMSRIPGEMSSNDNILDNISNLIIVLSDIIKKFWEIDINDCPFKNTLDKKLEQGRMNIINNQCDTNNLEEGTIGKDGFLDLNELYSWLVNNKPVEDLVFTHGDLCLPNIFINENKFSGLVDLGTASIADRYQDIAICYRSLISNLSGKHGYINAYSKEDAEKMAKRFLDLLDIEIDYAKIKYYVLLDELF